MAATFNPAARACGAQDCARSTSQAGHPLCRAHYQEFQQGTISPCPNHPQVYKPAQFVQCRECGIASNIAPTATAATPTKPVNRKATPPIRPAIHEAANSWNRQPTTAIADPMPPAPAIKAVQLVRKNIQTHAKLCANHETNTIQYLIMPLLKGLGWNESDPSSVIREYRPAGKRRYGDSIAVDIALLQNGIPSIFIEAKRLDREYAPEYEAQTEKYAAFLKEGNTAALTNGRHWLVYRIVHGQVQHVQTINLEEGDPETAAKQMQLNFGRKASTPATSWDRPPATAKPQPEQTKNPRQVAGELISVRLKEYRQKTAGRTKQPPYTILKDETIDQLAQSQPQTPDQLNRTQGIGPATMLARGQTILDIIRSAREQAAQHG